MTRREYHIHLNGGPHDGEDLHWMWNADAEGQEGERTGVIKLDCGLYQCNDERTQAYWVEPTFTFKLVGGPLDGAEMDAHAHSPDDAIEMPMEGEVNFGGLVYWLNRSTGIAKYLRGRDETGILRNTIGKVDGKFDGN